MDVTIITQLIGSLGFPVVCCGYMMIVMNKTLKENTTATNNLVNLVEKLIDDVEHKQTGD